MALSVAQAWHGRECRLNNSSAPRTLGWPCMPCVPRLGAITSGYARTLQHSASPSVRAYRDGESNAVGGTGVASQDVTPKSAQAAATSNSHGVYNWLQHWYPVAVEADMDKTAPHSVELFGRRMVVWWTGKAWSCVNDVCPHRLAPLSEGRIESDGTLQCSYHGFTFDGAGACTRMPQAPESKATTMALRRCRVASYPTTSAAGLVWVWPDGETQPSESAPPVPELFQGGDGYLNIGGGWLMRDVPYDFITMQENILDPAHALFAHHGLLGDRNSAIAFDMSVARPLTQKGGFALNVGSSSTKTKVTERTLTFTPPTYVQQKIATGGAPAMYTAGFSVPLRPGWCRLFSTSVMDDPGSPLIKGAVAALPRFALHAYTNEVLDGDLTLLHGQERNLEDAGGTADAFFLPTPADKGVILFRQWLEQLAGGYGSIPWAGAGPAGAKLPPLETRKEVLLDRYHQHTAHCTDCRKAHNTLETVAAWAPGTAAALAIFAALWATTGAGAPSATVVSASTATASAAGAGLVLRTLALTAAACLGAGLGAAALLPFFRFRDYVHSKR